MVRSVDDIFYVLVLNGFCPLQIKYSLFLQFTFPVFKALSIELRKLNVITVHPSGKPNPYKLFWKRPNLHWIMQQAAINNIQELFTTINKLVNIDVI
jgi:hypothetical protein